MSERQKPNQEPVADADSVSRGERYDRWKNQGLGVNFGPGTFRQACEKLKHEPTSKYYPIARQQKPEDQR
jgi:hypothetical protein